MKVFVIVVVVAILAGAVTVTPARTYALSLTPVHPERISRQDTRELCPVGITLRGTPWTCLQAHMQRQTEQMGRAMKRLQKQLEQRQRNRK